MPNFSKSVVLVLLVFVLCPDLNAQCSDWGHRAPSYRPIDQAYAYGQMVFDEARGVSLLFAYNAYNCEGIRLENWIWNGLNWSRIRSGDYPPTTDDISMAFDSARNVVVLFGGYLNGVEIKETWEWGGYNWTKRLVGMPNVSSNSSLAFDSLRKVTVMVATEGPAFVVWEYDGQSWIQRHPSTVPSPRISSAVIYDSKRHVTLLFGGISLLNGSLDLNDTWEWDGVDWTLRTPSNTPPGRRSGIMVFDSVRNKSVLFGGITGGVRLNDTWEWDGQDWTEVQPNTIPPAAIAYSGCFDSRRGKMVLYWQGGPPGIPREIWEYPNASPPVITSVSSPQNVCLGESVTFSVSANSESAASYQWRRDGSYIPGATTPENHIANADFGSPGVYDVIITNACGSTMSAPASLTVCAGPDGCPSPLDVNADGLVNGADIQRIVEVLLGL